MTHSAMIIIQLWLLASTGANQWAGRSTVVCSQGLRIVGNPRAVRPMASNLRTPAASRLPSAARRLQGRSASDDVVRSGCCRKCQIGSGCAELTFEVLSVPTMTRVRSSLMIDGHHLDSICSITNSVPRAWRRPLSRFHPPFRQRHFLHFARINLPYRRQDDHRNRPVLRPAVLLL